MGLLWTSDQLVAETSTWQHTTHTIDIHAPAGFEPTISAGERTQTYVLDGAATVIGLYSPYTIIKTFPQYNELTVSRRYQQNLFPKRRAYQTYNGEIATMNKSLSQISTECGEKQENRNQTWTCAFREFSDIYNV